MCCRYYMELSPELRPYIEAAQRSPLTEQIVDKLARPLVTSGVVRPTCLVPVIAPGAQSQKPTVFPMVWGFHLPRSSSPLINARSESAGSKPTFRESWYRRRCIIPASFYYEWEHLTDSTGKVQTGTRYSIQPKGSSTAFLAGLYRIEEIRGIQVPVFTVLSREPADEIRFIHDRMPVILPADLISRWIDPKEKPEEILRFALTDMAFNP